MCDSLRTPSTKARFPDAPIVLVATRRPLAALRRVLDRRWLRGMVDSVMYATAKEISEVVGDNWVVARSSPRIHARYDKPGCPVVCLTPKRYEEATLIAIGNRFARRWQAAWSTL